MFPAHRLIMSFVGGVALAASVPAALAQSVEDFYRGNTITVASGGSAGGAFYFEARVLMKYVSAHIPGNPNVIVQGMPGAGGAKMMSYLYNAAPKDGSYIGAVLPPSITAPLLRKVKYDPAKFQWLGSLAPTTEVSVVWHTAPAKTLDEAKKTQLLMATSSKLSNAYLIPAFLNATIGTRFKVIEGYRGGGPMNQAMETGEVHGRGGFYTTFATSRPDWVRDRRIAFLVQVGPTVKTPIMANVPNLRSLVTKPEHQQIVTFLEGASQVGYGYFVPPKVPKDRVAALRGALAKALRDPKFLAEAKQRRIIVDPVSAEVVQRTVENLMKTPKPVIDRFKKLVKLQGGKKRK